MSEDTYSVNTHTFTSPQSLNVFSTYNQGDGNLHITLSEKASIPSYQTTGSVGADLSCCEDVYLPPYKAVLVDTGVAIALTEGVAGIVYLRSSLGLSGVVLANGVGVIDQDYRGTIKLCLLNLNQLSVVRFPVGTRLAQLVITPVLKPGFRVYTDLDHTNRGDGSFGSTGTN